MTHNGEKKQISRNTDSEMTEMGDQLPRTVKQLSRTDVLKCVKENMNMTKR